MDSLQFEELDQVVEERKQDDGDDVHVSLADASLDTEQKITVKKKASLTGFRLKGWQMVKYLSKATATTLYTLPIQRKKSII